MPWLRIDDGEGMAPWVMRAGNEAYGVYVRLGSYCAQHLTNGVVPAPIAAMIAGDMHPKSGASKNLATLVKVGRIDRDEMGTVRLPYFLESNPSREQVESDRERRQAAGRKGGLNSSAKRAGGAR